MASVSASPSTLSAQRQLEVLRDAVQCNCHISDAQYAGNYSLCIYLLKMRELFRWEQGFALTETLPREAVGSWLSEREALWDDLAEAAYAPLPLFGERVDPFAAAPVNARLLPRGYVYGGGYGVGGKPLFFLGRLGRSEQRDGVRLLLVEDELARDLTAPPAMFQDGTVYVRRESLRRTLWERVESWDWNRKRGSRGALLADLGFDADPAAALERLTDQEIETVILHEVGEARAGERLGPDWERMLLDLGRSRAEFVARAVRDHLADCLVTLPALLASDDDRPLRVYLAGIDGLRKTLFPALAAADGSERVALQRAVQAGQRHWLELATRLLGTWRRDGAEGAGRLAATVEGLALH